MASNSLDACAALLLHGAEARTFARAAVSGSPVQQLLELFAGRAPQPGELPKLVNAVDPLLRPQVAQSLMSLAQQAAAGAPAQAAPPSAASAAPSAFPPSYPCAHPSYPASSASAVPKAKVLPASGAPSQRTAPDTAAFSGRSLQTNGHSRQTVPSRATMPGANSQSQPTRTVEARKEVQIPKRESAQATGKSRAPHASSLGRAAAADDLVEVTNLLKSRAEPNEYDKKGETPLFTAVSEASPDIVATLLLCNAEPLTKSVHGTTPWDLASCKETKSLLCFFAGQELEEMEKLQLLDSLSAMQDAIGHAISERAANRRGLRPAEELPQEDGAGAPLRQRPLPPLPPEVKKARDAMAAKDGLELTS